MFIGLAVGDALGAAVEFQPRESFTPVTGYRGGGPHGLNPGEWTDDTSLALALGDSLATRGWDLDNQAERYVAWLRTGKYSVNGRMFDVGRTTYQSLVRFEATKDARTSGEAASHSSGNGSIMRLAPVAIHYHDLLHADSVTLARRAWESSLPTHASAQCTSACAAMALMLAGLATGVARHEVLRPDWAPFADLRRVQPLHPEVEHVVEGSYRSRPATEIRGSGYVVACLEAALWAFHAADSFEQAVERAVNLGDDADTTGAVCGQLAGAYFGESGIPAHLRSGLARRDLLEDVLSRLVP